MHIMPPMPVARLILEDGTIYEGESFGSAATTIGEVVFVVASLIHGKPVHVRRAADLVFGWAERRLPASAPVRAATHRGHHRG